MRVLPRCREEEKLWPQRTCERRSTRLSLATDSSTEESTKHLGHDEDLACRKDALVNQIYS
jgi:hypothetical protein